MKKSVVLYKKLSAPLMARLHEHADVTLIDALDEPGLVMDSGGNLYGTTPTGGSSGASYGEVYKLATDGTLTVLHAFSNTGGDGYYPTGSLAIDSKGNLYVYDHALGSVKIHHHDYDQIAALAKRQIA